MLVDKTKIRGRMIMGLTLGLIGGGFAFRESAASALSDNNPSLALSMNSSNEIAAQRMANKLMKNINDPKSLETARALTLTSLKNAAGLAPSIRNYALLSEQQLLDGDPNALMQMATKFSRRDLPTQLWLIEKEAQGGDVVKTLAVYDLALTSNPDLREFLFPILASGLADAELIEPIANLLKTEPSWGNDFFHHFSQDKKAINNFPLLLAALGSDAERLIPIPIRQSIANHLTYVGQWDAAYETSFIANQNVNLSDFGNDDQKIAPPFGWSFTPSGTVGFSIREDNTLLIQVGRGSGTIIASRIVRLPYDNFTIKAAFTSKDATIGQIPRVSVSCANKGSVEKKPVLNDKGRNRFSIDEKISLPTCKFAYLRFEVPSNFSSPPYSVIVKSIEIQ